MNCLLLSVLLLALFGRCANGFQAAAYDFPLYKQCDPRWGNDEMGTNGNGERATICKEGCAMTSTAMALAGLGVKVNGSPVTPKTFNQWLLMNSGYYCAAGDCNNLNLTAPEHFSFSMTLIGETEKSSFLTVAQNIKLGRIIQIAHVRNNHHFVLLTGVADSKAQVFTVNDPGFNQSTYTYAEITDMITFKVNIYPHYEQCDPRWGSDTMGANNKTICAVGCLMTSISSALVGTGISIAGNTATPKMLNQFLRTHKNGYDSNSSSLNEYVVPEINPSRIVWPADGTHTKNDIPFATIVSYIDAASPRIVIANVRAGTHFVLVVGYRSDGDTLVVNDSAGWPQYTYSYSKDVVGWRLFDMH